ncbi:sodium:proton antiporter [Candidatus Endoriftia persephone str. Guaymas]|jgi:multicomponent Na+:H+ antiporter subunit B|uniref:Sodium:proton antiporter n=1 Tax=Candidatus Endoriftia persephonae TaxID=393765 RepID=A0A9J7A133_9GAMM|nr:MnhB domain-containing protein [Candidatus Endoriftia persephone]MBA1330111.1 sodium:proton antiporter [Candidatus Endoriftia persephone str. Guaymas]USF88830.1 sodium:proton antiporter [Candidatus Endoriftia persephone]
MMMRNLASLLFAGGLGFLLCVLVGGLDFGNLPMVAGGLIQSEAPAQVGTANIVTAVVLGYRGIDTLGELSILFASAAAAGLVLGRRRTAADKEPEGGFILRAGGDLLFPLLLVVGFYIIFHGHLTPGGGFQGGVILAAAFFLPLLARPGSSLNHAGLSFIEGLAGAGFILIGLWALWQGGEFLQPMLERGVLGELLSAGTLPLLYLAVGLKVGAELAGLLAHLAEADE